MAQSGSAFAILALGTVGLIALLPDDPAPRHAAPSSAAPVTVSTAASMPPAPSEAIVNRYGAFSIKRAADSHFYADAEVNGAAVRFLIDTGATSIVLTPDDAARARIGGDEYTALGRGVGGDIPLMPARADRLTLGSIVARDVPVMVAKHSLPVSLLGQSYLSEIGTVSITDDTMTLQ